MSKEIFILLRDATWETLVMSFSSGFFGFLIGIPLGLLLFLSRKGQLAEHAFLNTFLSTVVNIFRAIPFLILIVWIIPFTRALVGTSIGMKAALVPLTIAIAPFIARMVENIFLEIPSEILQAARAMGASIWQIIYKVLLKESFPSLINCASITLIMLVGYSAMGGVLGAGGLGQIGYQYGYVGYDFFILNSVLFLLILLVFFIQFLGNKFSNFIKRK